MNRTGRTVIKRLFNCARWQVVFLLLGSVFLPQLATGQDLAGSLEGFHGVLEGVREKMMPLSGRLIDVGRALAGFGALWYIAVRVWRQLAQAEAIDVYPLLRPFALGMAILLFPSLIAVLEGVLRPTVRATWAMMENSDAAIGVLLARKEAAVKNSRYWEIYVGESGMGDRDRWYRYTHPEDPLGEEEGFWDGLGNDVKFWLEKQSYQFRNSINQVIAELLELAYAAASLCLNTIRTFFLIVLSILGPLVLGFAVYDGFQHSVTQYLARYVNVYLWLPIANILGGILGTIQQEMLRIDISQIEQQGDTLFSSTDTAYLIFLVIGIVGYFSVPTIAGYVVHATGTTVLLQKVTTLVSGGAGAVAGVASGGATLAASGAGNLLRAPGYFSEGYSGKASGEGMYGAAGRQMGRSGGYLQDKLSGTSEG